MAKPLAKYIDHTLLKPDATQDQIDEVLAQAKQYGFASVCINPYWVVRAAASLRDTDVNVCTVIGFPNGYCTTAVKCFEAATAVADGAQEIDMVIHLGWVKEGRYDAVQAEIEAVRRVCRGQTLKVIIETCLLTEAEKVRLCQVVTDAGVDFIKTSTGFAGGGATLEDVALLADHVGPGVQVKASGGIAGLQDAAAMLAAGAARLGTSRVVGEVKRKEEGRI